MPTSDVTFRSQGLQLAADLYQPTEEKRPSPAVVMGPGFGGTKEMLFPPYAESLSTAGIAVLSIDYANFGSSEGEPRQHMDLSAQQRAYVDGLTYLETRDDIDSSRLGVFGSSMSGGHALAVAASDARVRSVVALIPFTGLDVPDELMPLIQAAEQASKGLEAGEEPQMITSHGQPGEFAAMNSDGAYEWMEQMSATAPTFRNEVTLASLWNLFNYHPTDDLSTISAPVHAVLATADKITPASAAKKAFQAVKNVETVEIPETHFELFGDHLQETIDLTTQWFSSDLLQ